jgi:hypothetical protein
MSGRKEDREDVANGTPDDGDVGGEAVIGSDGGGGWSGGFGDGEAPERDTSIVEDSPEEDDADGGVVDASAAASGELAAHPEGIACSAPGGVSDIRAVLVVLEPARRWPTPEPSRVASVLMLSGDRLARALSALRAAD